MRWIAGVGLVPLLVACGSGEWVVTAWGEAYLEEGIGAAEFADGCEAVFDRFAVHLTEASLLDGDGEVAGAVAAGVLELTGPGPQEVGAVAVPSGHYDTARFVVAPGGGDAIVASGTLTCGSTSVTFDWAFQAETTWLCEPDGLTIPAGGSWTTELTIHGDHLFYDGLQDPEADVRGQAIVDADADADADGAVTLAELAAVDVAALGYTVGQHSDVTTLADFVAALTRTLGHVDGEGHCRVAP